MPSRGNILNNFEKYNQEAQDLKEEKFSWWKALPGDVLTGKVEYIGEQDSQFGGTQKVIKIIDGDGTVQAKGFTSSIERLVEEKSVTVGDVISLKYFGEKISSKGNTFQSFNLLVHERAEQAIPT